MQNCITLRFCDLDTLHQTPRNKSPYKTNLSTESGTPFISLKVSLTIPQTHVRQILENQRILLQQVLYIQKTQLLSKH